MAGADRLGQLRVERFPGVQEHDLAPGGHDIPDDAVPEVEGIDRELFAEGGNLLSLATLREDDAEFLVTKGSFGFSRRLDPQDMTQEKVCRAVEQANDGTEEGMKETQCGAQPERDGQGLADGHGLRRKFAKHDVQEGDEREGEDEGDRGHKSRTAQSRKVEERLDQMGDEGLTQPAESEAGKRDPKLGRGNVGFQMIGDVPGDQGSLVPVPHQGIELAAPDLDDRKFRGDEKPVQKDKRKNGSALQKDGVAGLPMIGGERGGGKSDRIPGRHREQGGNEHHRDLSLRDGGKRRPSQGDHPGIVG